MSFAWPTNKQRLVVVGRTGSGKTQFGAFALAKAPFHVQPYIIIDYKGDELLSSFARAQRIGYKDIPKRPGLYYLKAQPGTDDAMNAFLWKVWKRGNTGLFFDEGYMVPSEPGQALASILTQGRSLRVPVIMLSQRPVWLSRFAFSEANQYAVFHLNDKRDVKTVAQFTPSNLEWDFDARLPEYHARWYDVDRNYSCILQPVPSAERIREIVDGRLKQKTKVL